MDQWVDVAAGEAPQTIQAVREALLRLAETRAAPYSMRQGILRQLRILRRHIGNAHGKEALSGKDNLGELEVESEEEAGNTILDTVEKALADSLEGEDDDGGDAELDDLLGAGFREGGDGNEIDEEDARLLKFDNAQVQERYDALRKEIRKTTPDQRFETAESRQEAARRRRMEWQGRRAELQQMREHNIPFNAEQRADWRKEPKTATFEFDGDMFYMVDEEDTGNTPAMIVACRYTGPLTYAEKVLAHLYNFVVYFDWWQIISIERLLDVLFQLQRYPRPAPVISLVLADTPAEGGLPIVVVPNMGPAHQLFVRAMDFVAALQPVKELHMLIRGWEGLTVRTFGFDVILQNYPQLHTKLIFALHWRSLRDAFVLFRPPPPQGLVGFYTMISPVTGLSYTDYYSLAIYSMQEHLNAPNVRIARYAEVIDRLHECEAARLFHLLPWQRNAILQRGAFRNRVRP